MVGKAASLQQVVRDQPAPRLLVVEGEGLPFPIGSFVQIPCEAAGAFFVEAAEVPDRPGVAALAGALGRSRTTRTTRTRKALVSAIFFVSLMSLVSLTSLLSQSLGHQPRYRPLPRRRGPPRPGSVGRRLPERVETCRTAPYFTPSSSTSKISVAFGGITPPAPPAP